MSSTPPAFGVLLDAFKDVRLIALGLRRKAVISPEDRRRWCGAIQVLERCIRTERASRKGGMSAGDAERWANHRAELQAAFIEAQAAQCGYCTNGMVMAIKSFLSQTPNPTPEQVKQGLAGMKEMQ